MVKGAALPRAEAAPPDGDVGKGGFGRSVRSERRWFRTHIRRSFCLRGEMIPIWLFEPHLQAASKKSESLATWPVARIL